MLKVMEKEDQETLRHISETLDKILAVLSKPQNVIIRIFEISAAVVGILGILAIIDVIRVWIGG